MIKRTCPNYGSKNMEFKGWNNYGEVIYFCGKCNKIVQPEEGE